MRAIMGDRAPPEAKNALSLLRMGCARLGTGSGAMDTILRGGFACGSLSEVCGEAGTGKTQLLLSLLIRAQLPESDGGLARKAVYVSTEGEPPMSRMRQIAQAKALAHAGRLPHEPLEGVFVEKAHSPEELAHFVENRLPVLMAAHRIGLVVVDSVAAPMRGDERLSGPREGGARAQLLTKMAAQLKRTAHSQNCVVVVSNQVTDIVEGVRQFAGGDGPPGGKDAALGLAWAQSVNVRLMLQRCHDDTSSEFKSRRATLQLSPLAPEQSSLFRIGRGGVEDLPAQVGFADGDHRHAMGRPRGDAATPCNDDRNAHI